MLSLYIKHQIRSEQYYLQVVLSLGLRCADVPTGIIRVNSLKNKKVKK